MNLSIRKIILSAINLLAGLSLLLGLFFNYLYLSGSSADVLINGSPINFDLAVIEPLLHENGFSMLDGKSTALLALYGENATAYESVQWLATLISNVSILALVLAVGCIGCSVASLFVNDKVSKILAWISSALALTGALFVFTAGLISSGYLNEALKMLFDSKYPSANAQTQADITNALSVIKFNTATFWVMIIVSLFFIAQVLFETLKPLKMAVVSQKQAYVPVTSSPSAPVTAVAPTPTAPQNTPIQTQTKDKKAGETPMPTSTQAPVTPEKNTENLSELQKEQAILELLPKYKKLMDEGIITPEEYEKKKNMLLWNE